MSNLRRYPEQRYVDIAKNRKIIVSTALISFNAFHCSLGALIFAAVWMVRCIWLVQTIRSGRSSIRTNEPQVRCFGVSSTLPSAMYRAKASAYYEERRLIFTVEFEHQRDIPLCHSVTTVDHRQYVVEHSVPIHRARTDRRSCEKRFVGLKLLV